MSIDAAVITGEPGTVGAGRARKRSAGSDAPYRIVIGAFAALIGAFLGWERAMLSFVLAFWIGGMVAIPVFLMRGGKKKDPIPFGTFMAIGVVLIILEGANITHWLMHWGPMGDF